MKVAISANEPGMSASVDARFGRAPCFVVVDMDTGVAGTHDNAINQSAAHGAGIQAAKTVVDAGAKAVITGNVGPKALAALQAAGVDVYQLAGGSVQQAVEQFKQGRLIAVSSPTT